MVLNLHPNIDMALAVKAKEQFLIGHYDESLETFRLVQEQITAYTASLTHAMETGDADEFESAEKAYSEWSKVLGLLQDEFKLVHQIQETCQMFRTVGRPNAPASEAVREPTFVSDAQLQAQHLADQAATDVRDPDVWPPPTSEAPARKRVGSVGGNNQWSTPAPSSRPTAGAIGGRTPAKPPQSMSRENSQENDDNQPTSARMPEWANRKSVAPSSNNAPAAAAKPRVIRKISNPGPPPVVAAPAPKPTRVAPPRKPAIPTAGRRGPSQGGSEKSAAKKKDGGVGAGDDGEDGVPGRVKFEAATEEEQKMVDMIEREILDKTPNVKMDDIAGLKGAKQLLTEAVVLPRLIPGYFTGKRKPWKGVLMFGPPGTGKTLLAKAVATECGTTFFNVSPSTVTSKYRGDSEKLMKLLFEMARFYAPSTIFMDEVDGLCSSRGGGGEHEASRRVKGEILQQLDGAGSGEYDPQKSVIVLGATNLPWELDTAFLRRFEKRVNIDLPDAEGRKEMFRINTEGMTVDTDVSEGGEWTYVVGLSEGYSGADIAVVCNDASMLGLRRLLAGKSQEEMKKMDKSMFNVPISRADFEQVFQTVKSSAGKNDLEKYKDWAKEYGSTI